MRISHGTVLRLKLTVRGAVQGVGFVPSFIVLQLELRLNGWVSNSSQGVFVEVEGEESALREFLLRVERDKPAISFIQSLESSFIDPGRLYLLRDKAQLQGEKTALVLPDIASCPDCLRDILTLRIAAIVIPSRIARIADLASRSSSRCLTTARNGDEEFPDVSRVPCGIQGPSRPALPCAAERLSRVRPSTCELWSTGRSACDARRRSEACLRPDTRRPHRRRKRARRISPIGGCSQRRSLSACCAKRKRREEKPFALMYPSLAAIREECEVDDLEERLLRSPESSDRLLKRRSSQSPIAAAIAPGNPYLGVMLPYTPLHHLIMADLQFPVVATSGNLSDEPICIDEHEAISATERYRRYLLDPQSAHRAPCGRLDRSHRAGARTGAAPRARIRATAARLAEDAPAILAVGAHQKNTIAVSVGKQAFISQHIGDLETREAYSAFERGIQSFEIAIRIHPDYRCLRPTSELYVHWICAAFGGRIP